MLDFLRPNVWGQNLFHMSMLFESRQIDLIGSARSLPQDILPFDFQIFINGSIFISFMTSLYVTMIAMVSIKNKKRYYIIGIGGVAMGNLAGLLKQKRHEVVGSDQETMYEPMKSMLKNLGISVFTPYNKLHVKRWKPDIVVVGNAINRGNPELEYVMYKGDIYRSVSDILRA